MRVCFVRLSALGDVVMMLPFVRTLQKSFPKAKLTWVISRPFYPIVSQLEGVEFIVVDKIRSFSDWQKARALFKGRSFDLLLGMQASLSAHLFYLLINAKRKIGMPKERSKDLHGFFVNEYTKAGPLHTVDLFLGFARHIGAKEISYEGGIPLTKEELAFAERAPYYVIHPCSSLPICDWPLENYIEIAKLIEARYGLPLVLTGAPKDKKVCLAIKEGVAKAEDLSGKTTIREMAALLAKAEFVIAPDTGPAHIASAFNTPVFGLYATSSSKMTGPYFSKETLIDKYEDVKRMVGEKVSLKSPRIYSEEAMQLITVEEVMQKIDSCFPALL
jgi:heptosyltransferase I